MKSVFKKIICFIVVLLITFIICNYLNVNAKTNDININDINSAALYSATNTYNYNPNVDYNSKIVPGQENNRLYVMNSLSDRNSNIVSTDKPLLTVLTHGLGGSAEQWSNVSDAFNKLRLGYAQDSIIASLYDVGNSNIYVAKFLNGEYILLDITEQIRLRSNNIDIENNHNKYQIDHITDISKHSVVLFDGDNDDVELQNYIVYREFNYVISRVVYDIKLLNNNILPKINLIGHSRGGLTNIEYALDHPDLVESIFSLGTPYCGSTSASIDVSLGFPIGGSPTGEEDIIKESTYINYLNRWNDNYTKLGYDKIKAYALGGYATLNFYKSMVLSEQCQKALKQYLDGSVSPQFATTVIEALIEAINKLVLDSYFSFIVEGITPIIVRLIATLITEALANLNLSSTCADDIAEILVSELNLDYHFPFVSWYNDGFVDLNSQLGLYGGAIISTDGYKGFVRKKFCFTPENSNTNAFAENNVPIVHNLEIRDRRMINYIMKKIQFTGKSIDDYEVINISSNEVGIKSYIGTNSSSTLIIPEYINGKKVVEICPYAFANNFNDDETITDIIIPSSINIIGTSAFENCSNLKTISFSSNSKLSKIDKNAFYGCININNIEIPDSVTEIGDNAFAYCLNLSGNFKLPSNLSILGENSLLATNISNISIVNNPYYYSYNYTLYNKEQSTIILSYASGNFTVPATVKTISDYAFINNKNITSINLNNVDKIGKLAFSNCENLVNVSGGNNINYIDDGAFISTKWYTNNEIIILGKTLVKYQNNNDERYTIPNNVTYVCDSAFVSESLKEVIIPTSVSDIGNYAFTYCSNLKRVFMLNTTPITIRHNTFLRNDTLTIYVPDLYLNDYKNSSYFTNYVTNISSRWVSVELYDDGKLFNNTSWKFYSIINDYPIPEKAGYDFIGWYCSENGKIYKKNMIFDIYESNCELTAVFEIAKYKMYLNYDNENFNSYNVSYGEYYNFPVPTKAGYDFIGWFDGPSILMVNYYMLGINMKVLYYMQFLIKSNIISNMI